MTLRRHCHDNLLPISVWQLLFFAAKADFVSSVQLLGTALFAQVQNHLILGTVVFVALGVSPDVNHKKTDRAVSSVGAPLQPLDAQ